jgi:replicative DNA helicase
LPFEDNLLERGMPAAPDVERSVLGLLLLDFHRYWATAKGELEPDDDFSLDSHRRIFKAMSRLADAGRVPDYISLTEALRRTHEIEAIGGMAYIASLTEGLPLRASIADYCQILKECTAMRELIHTGQQLMDGGADQAEAPVIAEGAIKHLQRIQARAMGKGLAPLGNYYRETYGNLANFQTRPGQKKGIPTPWKRYNAMTGGLQPEELTILAARPSMGKTSAMVNLMVDLGVEQRLRVGVFSLEQPNRGILDRAVCYHADVSLDEAKNGADFISTGFVKRALEEIERAPIYIDDTSDLTAYQIIAKAEMLELDVLLVDYLQYMRSNTGRDLNRDREIGLYTQALRNYARRKKIPVVCLAQLKRDVEGRADKRPRLSDLRESGNIEQDADVVTFIHRPGYYDREDTSLENVADFLIEKQRNGPTGPIRLQYSAAHFRFQD